MVYEILNKLKKEGNLKSCVITLSNPGTITGRGFLFGKDIVEFNKSHIIHKGGETGYEKLFLPLENVLSIESNGSIVFRNRPRIKKFYPR